MEGIAIKKWFAKFNAGTAFLSEESEKFGLSWAMPGLGGGVGVLLCFTIMRILAVLR
ncbi:MAG: hypothetical protein ACXWIN_05645 [Burkholderiaceae bacterium]